MAKGKKTGGRDVQKGQVLNPLGLNAVPQEIRILRKSSAEELAGVIDKLLHLTMGELANIMGNPTSTALEIGVAAVWTKAMMGADAYCLDTILNRWAGKPMQRIEAEISDPILRRLRDVDPSKTDERIKQLLAKKAIIDAEIIGEDE